MQIYHASEEYGIEDIRTSGGYFHLGQVFHELSRDDVAESMFDRVCQTSLCHTRLYTTSVTVCEFELVIDRYVHVFKRHKHILKLFSPSGSSILVFLYQTLWQYSNGDRRNRGNECNVRLRHDKSRFSTNISFFFS